MKLPRISHREQECPAGWLMICASAALAGLLLAPAAAAQPRLQFGQPVNFGTNGFHIYNAGVAAGYTSIAGPIGAGSGGVPGLGGDFIGYLNTSVGYSRIGTNGSLSITYNPSYVAHVRYSDLHFFNQNLNITLNKRLGSQWTSYTTLLGDDSTLENFLFGSAASLAVGSPGSTGGIDPTASSAIIFGDRVLSATALTGLIYKPTTRLRLSFDVEVSLQQYRRSANTPVGAVVPRNFHSGGQVNLGYSLNPRTEVGTLFVTTRNNSTYGEYQNSFVQGYVYRRLAPHWTASVAAGPAFTNYFSGGPLSAPSRSGAISYAAAATLGYDLGLNRFSATVGRSAGDAYGLGTGSTNEIGGSWDIRSVRTGWSAKAFAGQERFNGGVLTGLKTSHAGAGITRALSRQLSASLDYTFIQYSGGNTREFDAHVGRLSLNWIPLLKDTAALQIPRVTIQRPGDRAAPAGNTP